MLTKICRKCHKVIPYPLAYCANCRSIVDKERQNYRDKSNKKSNSKYNAKRDTKYTKFYNSREWKTLAAKVLLDYNYRCARCNAIATEVHHKDYIQNETGWLKRLDYDNCEPLCLDCHNVEHKRFVKRKA